MKDNFLNAAEPLNYTIKDIENIVNKEVRLRNWDIEKFDINTINEELDNVDFMIKTKDSLHSCIIFIIENTWQNFKYSGVHKVLNITLNSKRILNTIRNEFVEMDIDCYLFGDITNDCNGYIFMRVQFDRDTPEHLAKLQELNIIKNTKNIDFDMIEFNLFDEDCNKDGWLWEE